MKEVSFKSYSDIDDVEATTLRHGLYETVAFNVRLDSFSAQFQEANRPDC